MDYGTSNGTITGIGWFTLALINAGLAESKGRSRLQWFLVSLVLGPIATLLIVTWPRRSAPAESLHPVANGDDALLLGATVLMVLFVVAAIVAIAAGTTGGVAGLVGGSIAVAVLSGAGFVLTMRRYNRRAA